MLTENLRDLIDPASTALIVVDMQNDFLDEKGFNATTGGKIWKMREIVPSLRKLIESARALGLQVVFLQNVTPHKGDKVLWSPARKFYFRRTYKGSTQYASTLEGSWGAEIIPEISPQNGDLIVPKMKISGFFGTNLDSLLRSCAIKTVLITGIVTHGCVLSTARDAEAYDYYVVLVKDCVCTPDSELHEAAMKILGSRYPIATSSEIIDTLSELSKVEL